MALYVSGAVAANGASYTPVSIDNNVVLWFTYGFRNGGTTASLQTFNGSSMVEEHDNNINLAGGGDPIATCNYIVGQPAAAGILDLTYSGAMSGESGFAVTVENVDQATPIHPTNGSAAATYVAGVNNPSLNYDAPDNSTVLYYKFHGSSGATVFTTPEGFTEVRRHELLTSPAYRTFILYKKDVLTSETNVNIGADTTGTSNGGIHGYVVLPTASVPTGVQIGVVDTDNIISIGQTSATIAGSGFEAVQGTGTVTLSPTDDIADASAVNLATTAWSDTSITFDVPSSLAMLFGSRFIFVTNNSAEVNAAGKIITLNPLGTNQYLIIKEQNDLGILKGVVGIEFDADQIEWQTLSTAGGTVFMEVSGTFYINGYTGAVPSTDSILVRLGDNSDQTWSAASLETITLAAPLASANINGDISQTLQSFSQTLSGTEISIIDGNVSQNLQNFSQSLNGVTARVVSGDISSNLNPFSQALSGTEISIIDGNVSQNLNPFSQSLSGTEISIIDGNVSQTLNTFNQTLSGTEISIIDGNVSQNLNLFSQSAIATNIHIITANILQSLQSFSQTLVGNIPVLGIVPIINQPAHATITLGNIYSLTPSLSAGSDVLWFKEFGPDDMTVDPELGTILWDTASLPRGQGMRITIGCSNSFGEDLKTFIIHVDQTGTSKLMLMNGAIDIAGGTPTTIATTIRAAGTEINSGDTLVIPDGHRWASITTQNSAENTWDEQLLNELPTGLSNQHTTIISDGYTIIDSAPHDAILRDDKGLGSGPSNTGEFYKFSGIEWTGSNRGPIAFRMNGTLFEFCAGTDGSYAVTPTTQAEADAPFANIAGMYIGGNSSAENCFGFGDARYIFQSGNFTSNCSFNRCIARPDEYNGTNPRGGIIHYSVDNSGTFSSYVIDGDQEHLSPFYNNYAGAFGLPATNNETHAQSQLMRGCASINVDMNPILNDSNSPTNILTIEDFLLLDTTNTVTPWTGATSLMGIQSDATTQVVRLAMSETHRWDFSTNSGGVYMGASSGSTIDGAIFDRLGWDGSSATINLADLVGSSIAIDNANIYDFKGSVDQAGSSTPTTNVTTYDPKINGWDYPTRAEPESPVAILAQAPDLTKFAAPSNYLPIDAGWNDATNKWAWPHPEEQHIAARMRTYSKTGMAVRNPIIGTDPVDLTGTITGNRGFSADTESFSEYIWGQFGRTVPPLRVSAKATADGEVTFRIGKYRSSRGDTITKFNVYETSNLITPIGSTTSLKSIVSGISSGTHTYIIKAVDPTQLSAWAANEAGESGPSRELIVTVQAGATSSGNVSQNLNTFNQTLSGTEISIIDGNVSQNLNPFSQSLSGTEISIIDGNVSQNLNPFSQSLIGTSLQIVSGDISSNLNPFSQALSGTEISIIDGDISQTLNPFSQTLSGTEISIIDGNVSQTLNSFGQSLSGTEISIVDGNVSQNLNIFNQSLSGTEISIVDGDIGQTLNPFSQALSGTEISIVDGNVSQNLQNFSQSLIGTVPVPGISQGPISQTLNSFGQSLSGTEISIIDGNVSQNLNPFSQTLSGFRVTPRSSNGSISSNLNLFNQNLNGVNLQLINGNISQNLNPFSQSLSGTEISIIDGNVSQTLNPFSQTLLGGTFLQVLGNVSQTLNPFSQSLSGTEISIIDGNISQTLNPFSQSLSGTEISIIDADIGQTLNPFSQSLSGTEISIIDGNVSQTLNPFSQTLNGFQIFPDINILTTLDSLVLSTFNTEILYQDINGFCGDELTFIIEDSVNLNYSLQDFDVLTYTLNDTENLSFCY